MALPPDAKKLTDLELVQYFASTPWKQINTIKYYGDAVIYKPKKATTMIQKHPTPPVDEDAEDARKVEIPSSPRSSDPPTPPEPPEPPVVMNVQVSRKDLGELERVVKLLKPAYAGQQLLKFSIEPSEDTYGKSDLPLVALTYENERLEIRGRTNIINGAKASLAQKAPRFSIKHKWARSDAIGMAAAFKETIFSYTLPFGRKVKPMHPSARKQMLMAEARLSFHNELMTLLWQFHKSQREGKCGKFQIGCACGFHSYLPHGEQEAANKAGVKHTCRDLAKLMEYGHTLQIL